MHRSRDSRIEIRKARQGPEERALDLAFWAGLTADQRVELVWELTVEQWRTRGWDPDEPGLHRPAPVLRRR